MIYDYEQCTINFMSLRNFTTFNLSPIPSGAENFFRSKNYLLRNACRQMRKVFKKIYLLLFLSCLAVALTAYNLQYINTCDVFSPLSYYEGQKQLEITFCNKQDFFFKTEGLKYFFEVQKYIVSSLPLKRILFCYISIYYFLPHFFEEFHQLLLPPVYFQNVTPYILSVRLFFFLLTYSFIYLNDARQVHLSAESMQRVFQNL